MPEFPESPHELWEQEIPKKSSRVPKDQAGRPEVTPERKEKMDRELVALGTLMKDSGVWWQLDGALNISLAKGKYIGLHADVDISVLREDISKLESYLRARGYGLFKKINKNDQQEVYRRVGEKAFYRDDNRWQLQFCAIDDQGKIRADNSDIELPIIEVAVIERDAEGHPMGWNGRLPEKWLTGKTIDFQGVSINLSHPARFLFNKIWFTRAFDLPDIEEFSRLDVLSPEDIQDVEMVMTPTLESFERDPEIGQDFVNLMRERIRKIREFVDYQREV